MIDLTLKDRKPTKALCMSCGLVKPDVVIYDPNCYRPGGTYIEEKIWDVCEKCRNFINDGYNGVVEFLPGMGGTMKKEPETNVLDFSQDKSIIDFCAKHNMGRPVDVRLEIAIRRRE